MGLVAVAASLSAPVAVAADGASVYSDHCLTCHQAGGEGVPSLQPSLLDSAILAGDPDGLIAFMLSGDGASGEWGNVMPTYDFLTDEELAAVLTYARESFAGADEISPEDVAAAR